MTRAEVNGAVSLEKFNAARPQEVCMWILGLILAAVLGVLGPIADAFGGLLSGLGIGA